MTIYNKIMDEKLQHDIQREAAKIFGLPSGNLINMNILQVKKYYSWIKDERQNKLSLHIFLLVKLQNNKEI